ncbi:hypothetical protein [Flagellimonas sp. CMM7]|uniref:hypothetical protein n=1 Tax=Flagellimonas sp. CMM7 TaxID=2654676 RepID=UPI0013D7EA26|nr:hypothetical protein [Flagellimonas sp. CMM7]UII79834.1 hypothetical protein LV704_19510 [Flagellimonas sp. CMM7]
MKNIIALLIFTLFIACKSDKKESSTISSSAQTNQVKADTKALESGDYSALLIDFKCDIDISELSQVLEVAETDLSLSQYPRQGKCTFNLKGFGKNTLGDDSGISWGPFPTSKAQNKKEIESYLKRKKEGLKIMGMDIQLAETGDCYLAYQPAHGRLLIYNEHYDQAFLMNYGIRSANNDRTKEQHEALRLKMTDLANYLLKKHRK